MFYRLFILLIVIFTFTACHVVKGTARGVSTVAKVGWKTARVTAKVAEKTGKLAYNSGKAASRAVRTAVYIVKGKQIVPIERVGNSLYVKAQLGRNKVPVQLLIDTGASQTKISAATAKKLKIRLDRAEKVPVQLANGQIVSARGVVIPVVRLKGVRVVNVAALVLEKEVLGNSDGLLGMSFLNHFVFQIDIDKPELLLQQKAK
ncbi:MAG: retropepsin-like aspartic protease [Candidatus Omnitrophica bacterium]|nr:retropepsin-like aspartic protease [Candidatus Omnitrophota bacterium]